MNLKNKDLELILNWFDIAQDSLEDKDLKVYDKIKEYLEEEDMGDDVDSSDTDDDEMSDLFFDYDEDDY